MHFQTASSRVKNNKYNIYMWKKHMAHMKTVYLNAESLLGRYFFSFILWSNDALIFYIVSPFSYFGSA